MRKSIQQPNNLVQDRGILKLHKQATRSKNPGKKYCQAVLKNDQILNDPKW